MDNTYTGSTPSRSRHVLSALVAASAAYYIVLSMGSFHDYAFYQDEIRYIKIGEIFLHHKDYAYPGTWQPGFGILLGIVHFFIPDYLAALRLALALCFFVSLFGLYGYTKIVTRRHEMGLVAVLVTISSPIMMRQALGGKAELLAAGLLLWSLNLGAWSLRQHTQAKKLTLAAVSGMLGGMLAMTRPEGILYAALVGAGLLLLPAAHSNVLERWKLLCLYGAACGLVCLPWVLYVHHATGNWSILSTASNPYNAVQSTGFQSAGNPRAWVSLIKNYLINLQNFAGETAYIQCAATPAVLLLAGASLFYFLDNPAKLRPGVAFGIITTGIFFAAPLADIRRYYLIIAMFWHMLAGIGLATLFQRLRQWGHRLHEKSGHAKPAWFLRKLPWLPLGLVLALHTAENSKYLLNGSKIWTPEYKLLGAWAASELPDHAKLLVEREAIGFYVTQKTAGFSAIPKDASLDEVKQWCVDRGITHVVIHWRWPGLYVPTSLFQKIRDGDPPDYLKSVHEDATYPWGRFTVYAFRP